MTTFNDLKWTMADGSEIEFKSSNSEYLLGSKILDDLSIDSKNVFESDMSEGELYYKYTRWMSSGASVYLSKNGSYWESLKTDFKKEDIMIRKKEEKQLTESVEAPTLMAPERRVKEGISTYKEEIEQTEKFEKYLSESVKSIFEEFAKEDDISKDNMIYKIIPAIQSLKKNRKRFAFGGVTPVATKQYERGMCEYIKMPLNFKPSVIVAGLADTSSSGSKGYNQDMGAIPVLMIDTNEFYMRTLVGVGHARTYNHNEPFVLTIKNSSYAGYFDQVNDSSPIDIASKRKIQFKYENGEFIIAWSASLDILRANPLYEGDGYFGKGKVQYWIAFE